jgi:hypothetical protein
LVELKEDFPMVAPEPADINAWMEQSLDGNLALASRAAAVEVAVAEYGRQKADRFPDIDLFANINNRVAEGSLFGGGSDVDTADVGVRAQWTLFQGGRLTAKIREAKFKKQQAEDEFEVEKSTVRRGTRSAYLGVVSGIARADALKLSVDAQEMALKAKQKGFDTGSNSNLEVLDAKRDFYFVKRDFLKARYDYLLSMLNLKRQVGNLTPADLGQINRLLVGGTPVVTEPQDFPLIEDISSEAPSEEIALEINEISSAESDLAVVTVDSSEAEDLATALQEDEGLVGLSLAVGETVEVAAEVSAEPAEPAEPAE